jgi:hypothetical protein
MNALNMLCQMASKSVSFATRSATDHVVVQLQIYDNHLRKTPYILLGVELLPDQSY